MMDILRNCYTVESSSSDEDERADHALEPTEMVLAKHTESSDQVDNNKHDLVTTINSENHSTESCCNTSPQKDTSVQDDYFALNDSESSDSNADDDCVSSTKHAAGETASLYNEFWNPTVSESSLWDEPDKIWNCGAKKSQEENSATLGGNQRKRRHNQNKSHLHAHLKKLKEEELNEIMPSAMPISRPAFFIHHKIAPFLHQTVANKCPRSQISKETEHSGCVNTVVWCTQPEHSHLLLSASHDKTIKLWNVFSKDGISCLQTLSAHDKGVRSVQWINGTKNVISASFDKTARIFDIERGSELSSFTHSSYVSSVAVHPVNPNYFLTGSKNSIQCWDVRASHKSMRNFIYKDAFGQVEDIAIMSNGSQFFTCNDNITRDSADRNIMAWDFNKAVVLSNQIYQERYTCTKLALHPDQSQLIAQTNGDYIALFSSIRPYKLNKYKRFEEHKVQGYKIGCDFSPDAKIVASGSADGALYFYDFFSAKLTRKVHVRREPVLPVSWHPVLPSIVACGSENGSITVLQ